MRGPVSQCPQGVPLLEMIEGSGEISMVDLVFLKTAVKKQQAKAKLPIAKAQAKAKLDAAKAQARLQQLKRRHPSPPKPPQFVHDDAVSRKLDKYCEDKAMCVTRERPRKTIEAIAVQLQADQNDVDKWRAKARIDAIARSCDGSLDSIKRGYRCFEACARQVLRKAGNFLPPSLDDLLTWSVCFRNATTFGNYLCYLRVRCLLVRDRVAVFSDPAIRRAKTGIAKRHGFVRRPPMFLQQDIARLLLAQSKANSLEVYGLLWLVSYVFLLRVPPHCMCRMGNP